MSGSRAAAPAAVSTEFEPQYFVFPRPPRTHAEAQKLYNHIRTVAYWLDAMPLLLSKLPHTDQIPYLNYIKWIPGLGFDAIIGAILPIGGDLVGLVLGLYQIFLSALFGLPTQLIGWMLFYVVADSIVGFIPLIGDAIDFLFMSNLKNLALLEDFLIKSPQWAVVVAPPGSFQPTGKQQLGFWRSLWASWLGTKRQ